MGKPTKPIGLKRTRLAAAISVVAAASVTLVTMAQAAPGLSIQPSVQLSQTLTDNVNLSPTNKTSEAITQVTLGVGLGSQSGRLRGFLNFGLTGNFYARGSSPNSISNQNALSSNFDVEVVDGHGFVNVSATVAQGAVSSFGAQTGATGLANANTTEVRTLQVSPRWQGQLSDVAKYSIAGSYSLSDAKSTSAGGSNSSSLSAQVSNANSARLGWGLNASRQVSGFNGGRTTSSNRVGGSLSLRVDELDLQLGANAGRETSDLTTAQQTNTGTWGLTGAWAPSPRTRFDAQFEQRPFGKTHQLGFDYRTALTVWRLSDSRSLSTSGNQFLVGSRGTVFDLYFAQFASLEPDPVKRVDLVNLFLRNNGINPAATVSQGFLSAAATIQDQQLLSVGYRLPRGTATLTVTRSKSRRADTLSTATDDLASAAEVSQQSTSLSLSHRLTPEMAGSLALSTLKSEGSTAAQSNNQRAALLTVSGSLSRLAGWTLTLRRTLFETSLVPYAESALIGTVGMRF